MLKRLSSEAPTAIWLNLSVLRNDEGGRELTRLVSSIPSSLLNKQILGFVLQSAEIFESPTRLEQLSLSIHQVIELQLRATVCKDDKHALKLCSAKKGES